MFENLTKRLTATFRGLSGKTALSEAQVESALRDVRRALIEADVALAVVMEFLDRVRRRATGQEIAGSLTPAQTLLKIVQAELEAVMGPTAVGLELRTAPPAVILMAGLQGSGKTTTVAKLASWLKREQKKKVLVASADVYRPAAIAQLQTLAAQIEVDFFSGDSSRGARAIADAALKEAKKRFVDVLIVDTAGRLAIDDEMMLEIRQLHESLQPVETLFVVDAMTGQDAATTARAFGEALPLTGVVLTKADGDARGGAALSVRHVTGKPIKFIGAGEKPDAFEPFQPQRIASRILGMGDMMSLIEEAERKVDKKKAARIARKVRTGKGFDLDDMREQLRQMHSMGGVAGIMDKLPGMGALPPGAAGNMDDRQLRRMEAVINSMTPRERSNPAILNGSRKRRILQGAGARIQDLNRLLKQHKTMQRTARKMKGGNLQKLMNQLPGGAGPGKFPGGGNLPRF